MKKLLTLIILTLCVIFVFSACGGNDTPVDTSTDTGPQACSHSATTTIEGYAPTCIKTGLTDGKKCVSCGAIIVKQETISKVSHAFSSVIKIESSCGSSESYSAKICKDCGYFESNLQETVLHPHSFEYYTREATCTLEGIKAGFKCKNCNYIATEIRTEALGHSYDDNYTPNGSNHYAVCQRCGDKKESSHVCNSFTTVKEPNCFEKGRKVGVCTLCDGVVEEDIPIKHSWNNGAVTTEATCISKGDRLYTCTICGETKTEVIYEKPHPYDDGITTKEPTCTEAGSKLYTCTYCTGTKTETISALGHNWDNGTTIEEPTCVKAGSKLHTCKRCSETKIEPVSALGHNWDSGTTTVEANCYQTGNIHYLCQRCDAEKDEIVPKLHSFDKGTTLQEASCTQEGKVRYTCTICSAKYDVTLGVKHNTTHTQRVESTCTEDGNIEYWQCNDCKKYFSYVKSDYASFEYDGREYYNTSTYSYNYTETKSIVLKAKGHKYPSSWSYDSTQHYYLCKNGCGTKNSETNHIFEEKYALERKDDGSQYIYSYNKLSACRECYYSKVIDSVEFAHVHYEVEKIDGAEPTCTQSGLTYGLACGVCDEIYIEQETIPALGHNYVNSICTRCGLNSKLGTVGLTYELNSDGTAYICTGIGTATTPFIVIGSEYNGLPVTEIKANAFMGNYNIVSVVIPTTIKAIGDSAFYDCRKLVEVYNLSNSITVSNDTTNGYVGNYALDIYTDLSTPSKLVTINKGYIFYLGQTNYLMGYVGKETELVFPNMFMGKEYSIYKYAFYDNDKITSITIGLKTKALGNYAFSSCSYLTEINFNATAMDDLSYDSQVFYNAGKDRNGIKVTIGKNVTKIPAYLFHSYYYNSSYSPKITSVEFEEGSVCESIGKGAFRDCTSLTSITIPDSVTSIGYEAFYNCDSLKYNEYDNAYYLGNEENPYVVLVEAKDKSITSCAINENTKIIYHEAFEYCTSLTSVTIGNSVTSIEDIAFYGCDKLVEVYNLSSLNITKGSSNGYVGYYAKVIYTSLEEESILETVNDYIFMTWEDNYYLMGYVGSDKELTLPQSYNGNNYEIYWYAFYNNNKITKVTIPNSVTSIGSYAFRDCDSLASVTIGNSVTSIGVSAFYSCYSLTSVTIPNSVKSIGDFAFYNCTSLISVTIPNSVKSIGEFAFSSCDSLKYNEYDNGYYLGNEENPYLVLVQTKDIFITSCTIHENTKFIADKVFYDHTNLTEIKFNATAMDDLSINNDLFYNAGKDGNGIKVTIGNNVTKIPAYLFYPSFNSPKITSIEFEEGSVCESIGKGAFRDCTSLTSITIPDSVTSMGNSAFYDCTSLVKINFNATAMGDLSEDNNVFYNAGKDGNGIKVTIGKNVTKIPAYLFYPCSSPYSPKITSIEFEEESVCNSIEESVFYNCTSLTSITIPNSVTSIGGSAFYNCTSLIGVTLENSVTSIGDGAFSGCNSLVYNEYDNGYYLGNENNPYLVLVEAKDTSITSCTIHENTRFIHSSAFSGCTSLTSVTIGNGVTSIGYAAFYKCTSLTSITIPNSVTSIGSSAFSRCDSLTSVTIPDSVTSIGDYAFSNCDSLKYNEYDNGYYLGNEENPYLVLVKAKDTSITSCNIHSNTRFILSDAFSNCISLTSITVDENNTTYKSIDGVLYSKDGVTLILYPRDKTDTSFTIPDNVTSIGEDAFFGCTSLTSITIPNSVTSIGDSAFSWCYSLTSITIPNSVTSIGYSAFYGCDSLTSVVFKDTSYWYVSNYMITVTNSSKNVFFLTDTYCDDKWYKK